MHDPLWLLARQWQLGEFRGDDAGSIALVHLEADTHRLDGWRPGGEEAWRSYDPAAEPLERLVEEEPPHPARDPRLRLQGGGRFARALAAADVSGAARDAFLVRYGFRDDDRLAPRGLTGMLHRRLADGAALAGGLRLLADPGTFDAEADALGLAGADRAALPALAAEWLAWWGARVPAGAPLPAGNAELRPAGWDEHRLEYSFAARASALADAELSAAEYLGGRLDWWSFDVAAPAEPAQGGEPVPLTVHGVPAPARFGGMPTPRFWEMEDARIDIGSLDAAPHDLGRLLLVSFATVYGNDWLVVPVRLPVGTLTRVRSFTIVDVFGATESLGAAGAESPDWNLFGQTDGREPSGASPWFLLAPALPDSLESPPVESVLLARDEMANLAWAVEQRVEDGGGRPLERYDRWVARAVAPPPAPSPFPRYRVDTEVPEHWYPLAPEQLADEESVRLRLVPLARRVAGEVVAVMPVGVLLAGAGAGPNPLWLHEEEVPRAGAAVTRAHQRARWHDGSVHTWTARRKGSGTGESSSGLRFDSVERGG